MRVFSLLLTNDGEDERVGEVLVKRELYHVPAKFQESGGLGQTDENVNSIKEDKDSTEFAQHPNNSCFFSFNRERSSGRCGCVKDIHHIMQESIRERLKLATSATVP